MGCRGSRSSTVTQSLVISRFRGRNHDGDTRRGHNIYYVYLYFTYECRDALSHFVHLLLTFKTITKLILEHNDKKNLK